jgi:hypothetical protein
MHVSGQLYAPAALYPRGMDPRYLLNSSLVGPRAGLDTRKERMYCLDESYN